MASGLFEQLFIKSAVKCRVRYISTQMLNRFGQLESNATACATLANLCVLRLYDTAATACKVYMDAAKATGPSGSDYPDW